MESNQGLAFPAKFLVNGWHWLVRLIRQRPLQILGIFALMGVTFAACSTTGYVLDESNMMPIEGAYVVKVWNGQGFNPVHSSTVCYHIEVTQTDRNGKYWFSDIHPSALFYGGYSFVDSVYKPGYHESKKNHSLKNTNLLARHFGTQEEQFRQIGARDRADCGFESGVKKMLPIIKAIYEEKKANAVNEQQKNEVEERWLRTVEEYELGDLAATVNANKRSDLKQQELIKKGHERNLREREMMKPNNEAHRAEGLRGVNKP